MNAEKMGNRGRITIVEVITSVAALGFLAALWPVVADALDAQAPIMSTGTVYIFRLVLPLMLLVLLSLIFTAARQGA